MTKNKEVILKKISVMSCIIFEITTNFSWLGFRYVPGTFCINNVVLYSPKINVLNNKVLKFQLHQSVSQPFRQSITSVSQLSSQSVSQFGKSYLGNIIRHYLTFSSVFACLVSTGPFLSYCSFFLLLWLLSLFFLCYGYF